MPDRDVQWLVLLACAVAGRFIIIAEDRGQKIEQFVGIHTTLDIYNTGSYRFTSLTMLGQHHKGLHLDEPHRIGQ